MIRIEIGEPTESCCECCGKKTVRLTRFVYKDNDAFAVYYASFTPDHEQKILRGIIGLGEWGDDEVGAEARTAFPFEITLGDKCFNVRMIDAKASPWREVTFLGKVQNRHESLAHAWLKDVFHITDHIVTEDAEVVHYFK